MNVSKPLVEQILKTLPIGYYCGRDIDVELSDSDTTCINLVEDKIQISYPTISDVAKTLTNDSNIENDIRCLLYHEVSHAILTPKTLRTSNILNIFEDERIETVLKDYYLGVDFKQFVKRINNFQNEAPKSADDMFYQVVRYRVGPKEFTDRVQSIINSYQVLDRFDSTYYYQNEVYELYKDIVRYFDSQQQNQQSNPQSNQQSDQNNSQRVQSNLTNSQQNDSQKVQSSSDKLNENSTDNEEQIKQNRQKLKQMIEQKLSKYDSVEYSQEIDKLLNTKKIISKQNASAICAYSGRFDPRQVIRQDYKWFIQKNRQGHVKAYSKLHLNLFIDCSGSFVKNDTEINKLLKSLIKLEKSNSDFSFTLISCGIGQTIRNKNDRIQTSFGGTAITSDIISQYKQVQLSEANNINICLYDGSCVASRSSRPDSDPKYLSVFNNAKSILIVDSSNLIFTKQYCNNSRVIITDKYTQELRTNIFNALKMLI